MSNTIIQIKRSLTNSTPASLNIAELAYSYASNTFFIGTPDGSGTIAIGGKSIFDSANSAYNVTNATYTAVNSAFGVINAAYTSSNANYTLTNAAYTSSNAGFNLTNLTYAAVNSAFGVINAVYTSANADYVVTNSAYTSSNAGYTVANAAYGYANASNTWANATFVKLTAPSQIITGDLAITGNLFFTGNAVTISSNTLSIGDALIYLAANNYSGTDLVDIGFIANYGNTTAANVHTGLIRNHINKEYYLFNGYDIEPGANNQINFGGNNMTTAVLNADLITGNLWLGGANVIPWLQSLFGVANAGFGIANAGYTATNSAFGVINAAYTMANANYVVTNAAYTSSNAAYVVVNSAYTVLNAAYTSSNAGYVVANAAFTYANNTNTYLFATFSNAANITSGILPSGRLSGSYTGITGVGTINTGVWNGSTVNVAYGGTGIVSATLNGVLFGAGGNGAFQVTAAGTEGQVLTASSAGVPQFSMISGGTF